MTGGPPRRVLITGAAGFVGRRLSAALRAQGAAVRGLDLPGAASPPGVEMTFGSVADAEAVRAAMDGVTDLIHGAALSGLWAADPSRFDAVNVGGTKTVLAEAARAGVARAVHVSSFTTLVTGPLAEPAAPLDETFEPPAEALLGPYPQSKRRAELAAQAAAAAGLPVAIVLPSAPIGAGDVNRTPPARMLADLADGRLPAYLDCLINLVGVGDLVRGILAALERGAPGRRYLLTGEDLEMRDLVGRVAAISGAPAPRWRAPAALALTAARAEDRISRLTGRAPTAPLTGVRLALRRRRFSAARAEAELGWRAGPIEPALREAIAWLRAPQTDAAANAPAAPRPTSPS